MLTHKGTQSIETERLLLRRFKLTDAEYMFKNWANDSGVFSFLFNEIGINRIEGRCNTLNIASGRIMQKSGMKFEGIMRQADINKNGEFGDLAVYSILKSDLIV